MLVIFLQQGPVQIDDKIESGRLWALGSPRDSLLQWSWAGLMQWHGQHPSWGSITCRPWKNLWSHDRWM